MDFKTILFSEQDHIVTLTISRPEAMNALNRQVLEELKQAVEVIGARPDVRVILLTGQGEKAFVAGADIKELENLDKDQAQKLAENGHRLFTSLETLRVPSIAVVNGFALGGGLELALACDFILASEQAKFGLPECTLGIMPGYGGTVRLPRRVGIGKAREIAYTGSFYSASDAALMGLVNHVYPAAELMNEAVKLARTIASRAPVAINHIKQSLHEGEMRVQNEALAMEAELFSELFATHDKKEGTKAFIEKRKPLFEGR